MNVLTISEGLDRKPFNTRGGVTLQLYVFADA